MPLLDVFNVVDLRLVLMLMRESLKLRVRFAVDHLRGGGPSKEVEVESPRSSSLTVLQCPVDPRQNCHQHRD